MKLHGSCLNVAHHASQNVAAGEPGGLRSCPKVDQKLTKGCLTSAPEDTPKFGQLLAEFGKRLTEFGNTLVHLGPNVANIAQIGKYWSNVVSGGPNLA